MKLVALGVAASLSCSWLIGCADEGPTGPASRSGPTGRVAVAIAPLSLPGVENACFTLAVYNGDPDADGELVWTETGICADDYGDGAGSITYVGTCDAGVPSANVATLVLDDLYAGGTTPMAASSYVNPCPADAPCQRVVPCVANADARVDFSLTVLRDASQGFFDVAVDFADVFCSAKLDCTDGDGPLELLHDPRTGQRADTAVLGFACTAGMGETTWMHLDDIVIRCADGGPTTVDPLPGQCSGGRSFADDAFAHATPAPGVAWSGAFFASGLNAASSHGEVQVVTTPGGGNTGPDPDPVLQFQVHHRGISNVHTWALYPLGSWNPAVDGPITKLSARYDARLAHLSATIIQTGEVLTVDPGQGGNMQLAIVQGGVVYAPSLGLLCGPGIPCDAWHTKSASWDLAALGVGPIDNPINVPNSHLNVTNGGPITFGVLVGLSDGAQGFDFDYTYEIDNWSVTIETACTDPAPGLAGPALPGTFQTATYFGREQLDGLDKCYWNVALGLDLDGDPAHGIAPGLGKGCVLETRGTASPGPFDGGMTPPDATWPVIHWQVPLTDPTTGELVCGAHAVNVPGSGVATEYTGPDGESFDRSRACSPERL
ncbi:MAG: hypothetical protein U1F43_04875 [Myxococcota bacterium]